MRAVQITEFGGPEVLRTAEVPEPEAGPGSVLIQVRTAGINYADTHQAEDSYLARQQLPLIPGSEVVGTATTGPDAGRRVLALLSGHGGYAERAVAPQSLTYPLPDALGDAEALALLIQGATAWHLLRTCSRMTAGESVLVHSAAGGVGSIAVQLARHWGAGRIIGTASGPEKAKLVATLGADEVIDVAGLTDAEQVTSAVTAANGGRGVDVVLEMTGGSVFDGSLAALAPFGRLVLFGMAGRVPPAPIDAGMLLATSRSVSGFWMVHALGLPGGLAHPLEELFSLVAAGCLRPVIGGSYPLDAAASAHQDLRSRRTTGKLVLDVAP